MSFRAAVVAMTAALVLPVLPAVVAAAPASAAAKPPASAAATADWLARDAKAKATIAHLARRASQAASRAARNAAPADRDRLRAEAAWHVRNARAKSTMAWLAKRKAAVAARPAAPKRASRGGERTPLGVWDRLAQCEAGGNWKINTGNGYYGGLQFSIGSWRAVGGGGYPHNAGRDEQIRRGELLKAKQGWGAWPSCSRKLGLR